MLVYRQLNVRERKRLYSLLQKHLPIATIAKRLGRHRSTIYREIARKATFPVSPNKVLNNVVPTSPGS